MKKSKFIICNLLLVFSFAWQVNSQQFQIDKTKSIITVSGTSSLHDWDVTTKTFDGEVNAVTEESFNINHLFIKIKSTSLKSGKKSMDKNTYKALKTKKHEFITFTMTKMNSITPLEDGNYRMKVSGDLEVAGQKRSILITFLVSKNQDGIGIIGSKVIHMTDYGIEPPKALLGAITTGDQITIKFNTKFKTEQS
ncbi:YceI family protein [Tenacibaculum tangerinum]|uniref:YceI family protein n=1 Tax=Tenacibaculum tangerinum TaxID=3038772 RepID=A0ABY8L3D9_9FLAO|nr:YceI family protein [Tenacibaculum tangerinum]WGH75956.1 YceI family protein [Tenacibaculum tangerinum]